ncbi:hypothetical protein ACTSKR_09955 [Chitinibacteraceae bacterium HSL-7]
MPINYYDLQRFEAIKVRENIKKTGSPDRFGKKSNDGADGKEVNPLLAGLLKKREQEQS